MSPPRTGGDGEYHLLWGEVTSLRAEVIALKAEVATLKAEVIGMKELLADVDKDTKALTAVSNRVKGGVVIVLILGGFIGWLTTLSGVIVSAVKLWFKGG